MQSSPLPSPSPPTLLNVLQRCRHADLLFSGMYYNAFAILSLLLTRITILRRSLTLQCRRHPALPARPSHYNTPLVVDIAKQTPSCPPRSPAPDPPALSSVSQCLRRSPPAHCSRFALQYSAGRQHRSARSLVRITMPSPFFTRSLLPTRITAVDIAT